MSDISDSATRFMTRFNDSDLDGIVSSFAEDGVYIDPHGVTHRGQEALRQAFAPIFNGTFGKVRYEVEDAIYDDAAGKALVTWSMVMAGPGATTSRIRGLDVLAFAHGQLVSKNAYCKSTALLIE